MINTFAKCLSSVLTGTNGCVSEDIGYNATVKARGKGGVISDIYVHGDVHGRRVCGHVDLGDDVEDEHLLHARRLGHRLIQLIE